MASESDELFFAGVLWLLLAMLRGRFTDSEIATRLSQAMRSRGRVAALLNLIASEDQPHAN